MAGLLSGGAALFPLMPNQFTVDIGRSLLLFLVAGVFVGFGTQMANGCTSGHGVCGLSRLSIRSLAATLTFMGTAIVTVFLMNRFWEGNI